MEHRIAAAGELDIATAPELLRRLDASIDANPGSAIVIDFGAVTFVDSTGLGALMVARRRARTHGGRVGIVNARPAVQMTLQVTGLDKLLLADAC